MTTLFVSFLASLTSKNGCGEALAVSGDLKELGSFDRLSPRPLREVWEDDRGIPLASACDVEGCQTRWFARKVALSLPPGVAESICSGQGSCIQFSFKLLRKSLEFEDPLFVWESQDAARKARITLPAVGGGQAAARATSYEVELPPLRWAAGVSEPLHAVARPFCSAPARPAARPHPAPASEPLQALARPLNVPPPAPRPPASAPARLTLTEAALASHEAASGGGRGPPAVAARCLRVPTLGLRHLKRRGSHSSGGSYRSAHLPVIREGEDESTEESGEECAIRSRSLSTTPQPQLDLPRPIFVTV